MAKLTIKEIAKLAGVSISAVSIALNNRPGISDETRVKILEIVDRLQYTPNPNSRRLLFNKTNNIAVLFKKSLSPLDHFFYSELNRIILHECESLGYNLIFSSVSVDNNKVDLPNVIKSHDVDGVIFYGDMDSLILNEIKKFDLPCVLVDNHNISPDCLCVHADYSEAAYTAAIHLIELGHRNIAYIGSSLSPGFGSQTFSGFKKAMEQYRITLPFNFIQLDANDEATAYNSMESILSFDVKPSALLCAADIFAIGAIRSIKGHGLTVPGDISVTGIDDIILASYVDPPLTTVRIDKEAMGRTAIDLLVKKIEKEDATSKAVCSSNLVIRASSTAFSKFSL